MANTSLRKFFLMIVLCALIIIPFTACDFEGETSYFETLTLEEFLYTSDYIAEEDIFREMMDDEFDQILLQYYSGETIETIETGNLSDDEVDLVDSILSFEMGCYAYLDENEEDIVSIPLSSELMDWWANYGDNDDDYRRPLPEIYFDGTEFGMKVREIPGNSTASEMMLIADDDRVSVDDEVIYEFLMRTYGIQKDQVEEIVMEDTCEIVFSDRLKGEIPIHVVYLWFTTTDGIVSKLYVNNSYDIGGGEYGCYIGYYSDSEELYPLYLYPWHKNAEA